MSPINTNLRSSRSVKKTKHIQKKKSIIPTSLLFSNDNGKLEQSEYKNYKTEETNPNIEKRKRSVPKPIR